MKIRSTNISKPTTIIWNEKEVLTGIYKKPINKPIYLGKEDVKGDEVSDRKHHGGEFKACYLFSKNQYEYWKNLYPNLNWELGMFGENLSVEGLDEAQIRVGSRYQVGEAIIEATKGDPARLTSEAADVMYHLLVMCAAHGVTLSDIEAELANRTSQSGLREKANR